MALEMNPRKYFDRLGKRALISTAATLVVLVIFFTLPFYLDVTASYLGYYIFITCVYLTVAQGWNLVAGYTGQISLGQNAFFGLGAYTMSALWLNGIGLYFFFDVTLMIAAGIVPALVAILIGLPLLSRLKGDYFSFGTLGAGMIINVLFVKGGDLTGGAGGVYLDAGAFTSMRVYYWVGLLVAFLATLVVFFMTNSRIGLALKAIREDDISAASHGINILKYKVLAFAVAAFMAGVSGSMYGYYLFHLEPASAFNMNWLFYPILVVVLGGTGTVVGPLIGAFIVTALFAYGDIYFGGYQPIVSGLLIILVMRFMPGGIMGLLVKAPTRWREKERVFSPDS
jgi:branched-chain amino acid transport system permease protein